MSKFQDLTGHKFGKLTVVERAEIDKWGHVRWLCRCACGKETVVWAYSLKSGNTRSCGCESRRLSAERSTKHGECGSRLYHIWHQMLQRCENQNTKNFKDYGGRGIQVCEEWHEYLNFSSWARSHGYAEVLTIDRIDTDGNYCPENCRWATVKQQTNNRRNTVRLSDGASLAQLCSDLGIQTYENGNPSNIYQRILNHWIGLSRCKQYAYPELVVALCADAARESAHVEHLRRNNAKRERAIELPKQKLAQLKQNSQPI